jgi:hypothetical protein
MQTEVYESDDYRNYFNLISHHSERKTGDMFHRAMFTIFLLRFVSLNPCRAPGVPWSWDCREVRIAAV